MRLIPSFCLLLLCSCQRQILLVESESLGLHSLASAWVGTPDPRRCCPPEGERLIVSWNVPYDILTRDYPHLLFTIRLGNHSEEKISIPIGRPRGTYFYTLVDEEYREQCGIQSYKVDLIADGCVVHSWYNQTWVELISFPDES